MTSVFHPRAMTRRFAVLAALSSSLWLVACGGNNDSDSGTTNLRAINLTTDIASLDLYTGDTKRLGPLVTDTIASSVAFNSGTYAVNVKRTGDAATLFSGSYSLAKDQHYTAIVWGRETALRVSTLPEDENNTDVLAGTTRVRVFNATIDSGTVDVYLTATNADLAEASPTQASLPSAQLAGFRDVSTGTYRLRVTAAGDPSDVRMDVPSVTFGDRQFTTLVLTAGAGGALLNGTLIVQQGAVTSMKNTKARIRLAASVDLGGLVSVNVGGAALFTNYRSPRVGTYALVDSGDLALAVGVNGVMVNDDVRSFAAGADYTLLAYGTAATAQVKLITDDNRVPSTTNRAKVRLINGLAGSDPLTLTVDYQSFAATSDIAAGVASAYATPTSTGSARLDVTSPLSADPIFSPTASSSTATLLQAQGVYTVFMLSGQTEPAGRFVRDR